MLCSRRALPGCWSDAPGLALAHWTSPGRPLDASYPPPAVFWSVPPLITPWRYVK